MKKAGAVQSKKNPVKPHVARGHFVRPDEITRLRESLREAQETLDAIRSGEVDAVVVHGVNGNQIYSLTSAEQPYRIYVEQMQEGAVTLSADFTILYCNQRFADMIQRPLEQTIGSEMRHHLGAEDWEKFLPVFQGSGKVIKHESILRRADGSQISVNLAANLLPMEEQHVMCLVVTDLTEQKKQAELRLAKDLAEKANTAKDDFLAALSHELRTPLTPVLLTMTSLEQNRRLPKKTRDAITMIRRNVELEARLIDDLLDITRISRGKMELHLKEFDFHTLVRRALEICRAEYAGKSQTIKLQLQATHYKAEGDVVRLQQAMWNLLRNAAKFTGPKGTIIIRTRNSGPDKILLEVEDTGVGFTPESGKKLFTAFEQGGRHITRQFGGLGLGLAITRSIIKAHNGTIQGTSRGLGWGATFAMEIPLRQTNGHSKKQRATASRPQDHPVQKRILLVEDHPDTRKSLEFLLTKNRHLVKTAATAKEALELAATHTFDLVISDIGLPDQSGLELMRQLKKRYQLKGIGLSGFGMEEDIASGREAGFSHYLTKPVRFEQLKQAIALTV